MTDHILRDHHRQILLAIMHQEPYSDKVGENGAGACLGFDGDVVGESFFEVRKCDEVWA